jgi:hypothetical protein
VTLCCFLLAAGAAHAADAPHVQQRIVPGQSIGKIALGMSFLQVKKVLGAPEAVIKRERGPFGRQRVEYSWSFTQWRITFRFDHKGSRAVAIRSSIRTEKTLEGIGVGTLQERVERAYRVRCPDALVGAKPPPLGGGVYVGRGCLLERNGRRTTFLVHEYCGNVPTASACAARDTTWRVSEVGVYAPGEPLPWVSRS